MQNFDRRRLLPDRLPFFRPSQPKWKRLQLKPFNETQRTQKIITDEKIRSEKKFKERKLFLESTEKKTVQKIESLEITKIFNSTHFFSEVNNHLKKLAKMAIEVVIVHPEKFDFTCSHLEHHNPNAHNTANLKYFAFNSRANKPFLSSKKEETKALQFLVNVPTIFQPISNPARVQSITESKTEIQPKKKNKPELQKKEKIQEKKNTWSKCILSRFYGSI